jgi:hypothetical protein
MCDDRETSIDPDFCRVLPGRKAAGGALAMRKACSDDSKI